MVISVIVPARNDRLLKKTVDDINQKFRGDFEIIVILDGATEYEEPDRVAIRCETSQGIRPAINRAIAISKGDYILKVDAHCMFCEDFDRILLGDIQDDQVMVARRYTLDIDSWTPQPRAVDYYYLSCPWTHPHSLMMQSCPWISHTSEAQIDDLMCFQGSMWMMSREHWDWLGGLSEDMTYAEHHEISMKTWLGGRRVVTNKNTWYAHPKVRTSGYHMSMSTVYADHERSARYWISQPGFGDLIDRFWPLPTEHARHHTEKYYWPEDWRKYYE